MSKKTANIRFLGFSDTWKVDKLNNLANFSKGRGYKKSDLITKGNPIVLYGRLYTSYETVITKVDTFVNKKSNSVFSKGGEVIVPSSGETALDISRASVIVDSDIILGGDLNIVIPLKKIDPVFLALTISNGKQRNEMAKRAQGSSIVHLHNSDLKQVNLNYPHLKEQQQIGLFFKKIDDLINVSQRELELLQETKKAFMQKLFPKDGYKVPDLRFEGFVDSWENLKLGKIYEFFKGKGLPLDTFNDDGKPSIAYGHLYTQYSEVINEVVLKSVGKGINSKKGDVLFPGSSTVPNGTCQANALMIDNIKLGGDIIIARAKDNQPYAPFVSYMINSQRKKLFPITTGTTITHMYGKDIAKVKYSFPKISEQTKIGQFLENIDNLITLHQRQLDSYKELKKGFLQKMFV